ncbi:uncharacterized protein CC84DRAFT_1161177 [Paraphaeosphaeria sporulosa]|uniref:Uncharacterized protein n=1 Tax=Paraphaeosphaeria sporulosa TaxID=1460663 RepID=A0A177CRM5_9PLEO|nr:uncharacterized protein CC84DRAFT_1161177 [Paraphaeosphaeria sporulosa]OAG10184.1 hypothetical protein CC84DRAFT_1161177 [Paraphaeosphaeria sporulosa]
MSTNGVRSLNPILRGFASTAYFIASCSRSVLPCLCGANCSVVRLRCSDGSRSMRAPGALSLTFSGPRRAHAEREDRRSGGGMG